MVIAIPGLLILVLIEVLVARWKGASVYRFQDTITSINIGLLSQFVNATGAVISVFMYNAIETRYGSFEWQTTSMLTWVFALLLYDFLYYWVHRTGIPYPDWAKKLSQENYNPPRAPFAVQHLREADLSDVFINYMRKWDGFVSNNN